MHVYFSISIGFSSVCEAFSGALQDTVLRAVSRENSFWKMGGCQNQKHPNSEIQFSKSQKTDKDSICSKQLTLTEKQEIKINILINMEINLSSC